MLRFVKERKLVYDYFCDSVDVLWNVEIFSLDMFFMFQEGEMNDGEVIYIDFLEIVVESVLVDDQMLFY